MSDETAIEAVLDDQRVHGLTDREYVFVSRVNEIAVWLAHEDGDRDKVVEKIRQRYDCSMDIAKRWLLKAEDYLAMGAFEDAQQSRRMYIFRLERIHAIAMDHAVADRIEVTTKPTRLKIEGTGEEKVVNATQTKVKPNSLDVSALQTAMKAAREIALMTGGKSLTGGTVNTAVIINGQDAHASVVQDLSVEALAQMAGVAIDNGIPTPEVVADAEVLPSQEEQPGGPADGSGHDGSA